MRLARFSSAGIAQFVDVVRSVARGGSIDSLNALIQNPDFSIEASSVEIDTSLRFSTRYQCGQYLNELLAGIDHGLERDPALWSWLAAVYFDQLCPLGKDGARRVGELARYVPASTSFQKFYRHLLVGPFLVYRAHADQPDRARALLANPVHSPGEVAEQFASRQELVTNRAVLEAATELYVDRKTLALKIGAGGKSAGSARRFADFINQIDLTHDLYAMDASHLLSLLPREFDRFRSKMVMK